MSPFYQMLEIPNLSADDVKAGAPEVYALDVDAEAFGEGDGVGEAGGGEEVAVVGAEGTEVVVEGRAIVVAFD